MKTRIVSIDSDDFYAEKKLLAKISEDQARSSINLERCIEQARTRKDIKTLNLIEKFIISLLEHPFNSYEGLHSLLPKIAGAIEFIQGQNTNNVSIKINSVSQFNAKNGTYQQQ